MRATKWMLVLFAMILVAIGATAQQRDAANVGPDLPVPLWPASGVVPADLKGHYVFLDLSKNEYVVAYPENLGSPDFEKAPANERRVIRYKLQRDVEPLVTVAVAPSTPGKFKYSYTVTDGALAKQSIDQWLLAVPEAASGVSVKAATGWYGVMQKGRKMMVANPEWIKASHAVIFSFAKSEDQIQPGSKKGGFEVESELKPGFTVGFFRQTESVDSAVQTSGNIPPIVVRNATPPAAAGAAPAAQGGGGFGGNQAPTGAATAWQPIKDDIDKLLQFEYNSKAALAIGPKFDNNATEKTIAADFQQGITMLSRGGAVNPNSAFVKTTLADLDTYLKAGGSGPLKLSAQPQGEIETQILNAMKVSLRVN